MFAKKIKLKKKTVRISTAGNKLRSMVLRVSTRY